MSSTSRKTCENTAEGFEHSDYPPAIKAVVQARAFQARLRKMKRDQGRTVVMRFLDQNATGQFCRMEPDDIDSIGLPPAVVYMLSTLVYQPNDRDNWDYDLRQFKQMYKAFERPAVPDSAYLPLFKASAYLDH